MRCKNAANVHSGMPAEPVDVSSLLALRELQKPGQPDVVARIVSRFLEESDERIRALRTAIATGDASALERAAHALKGIAGTVGANEMMRLAVQLEQFGRDKRIDGAADLVVELERALDHARPIFDGLCNQA